MGFLTEVLETRMEEEKISAGRISSAQRGVNSKIQRMVLEELASGSYPPDSDLAYEAVQFLAAMYKKAGGCKKTDGKLLIKEDGAREPNPESEHWLDSSKHYRRLSPSQRSDIAVTLGLSQELRKGLFDVYNDKHPLAPSQVVRPRATVSAKPRPPVTQQAPVRRAAKPVLGKITESTLKELGIVDEAGNFVAVDDVPMNRKRKALYDYVEEGFEGSGLARLLDYAKEIRSQNAATAAKAESASNGSALPSSTVTRLGIQPKIDNGIDEGRLRQLGIVDEKGDLFPSPEGEPHQITKAKKDLLGMARGELMGGKQVVSQLIERIEAYNKERSDVSRA